MSIPGSPVSSPVMITGEPNVAAPAVPDAAVPNGCRGIGSISPGKLGWMGAIPKSPAGTGTTGSPMSPTTPTIAVTCHRILMCWRLLPQRRFLCGQHRFGGGAGNQVNYRNLYREIPDAAQVKAEARRSGAAREVSFDGPECGFRVDSDRGLVGLDVRDRGPVLEESQLLELLGDLERRGWQEVEGLERGAPVGVEADVLEASDASSVAVVRDRVLREVERPAVGGADDLVHVRVVRLVGQEPDLERRHLGARALPERRDEERDVARRDQRLVALDVHVHVGGARLRDLPDAVRSRRMLRRR